MRRCSYVVLASTNRHKLREFQYLAQKYHFPPIQPMHYFVANPEKLTLFEKGKSYLENALSKARALNKAVHTPVLADDSGLEVDALGGKPGVFSARYATAQAGESQDQANRRKLLEELSGVPLEKRTARFVCALVLEVEGRYWQATGVLEGTILEEERGEEGFGYDPLFLPKGSEKTLAEMSFEEKNQISHRAQAFAALVDLLQRENAVELAQV